MPDTIAILCPGQGAQAVGMAKAWADASTEAKAVLDEADLILGDSLGAPLSRLCFEGPEDTLARTDVSQPAIFAASVASFRAEKDAEIAELKRQIEELRTRIERPGTTRE